MKRSKYLLTGGIATAAAALVIVPSVAFADTPTDRPLLTTTCTYEQVKAALSPEAAERLENRPKAAARLQKILALTPDERQAKFEKFRAEHPKAAERIGNRPPGKQARAALHKALETCGNR